MTERKFEAVEFEADAMDRVGATPDRRLGDFTFKDVYGNTLTIRMSEELGAHFVATCQKVFVGSAKNRGTGVGSIAERRENWSALALSYVTSMTARPTPIGSKYHAQVHLQLDRGFPYEQNLGLTPQEADRVAEELQAAAQTIRDRQKGNS